MKKNLFIAFEGIDGSGKSTQIKLLTEQLKKNGHKVYSTFEPTDGIIGSLIRDILNHKHETDERVIAALFAADRLEHLTNKDNGILKRFNDGYTVICDRYYLSSYAYHGINMPLDWIIQANALSASLLKPDLNIYIDISAEISMERLQLGRDSMELYENLENLKKVRSKYLDVISLLNAKERIAIIDGNRKPDVIADEVWETITNIL